MPRAENTVNYGKDRRAPLLLIAGSEDNLVPPIGVRLNYRNYVTSTAITDYKEFPNRSHLIVAQEGWQEVAEYALSWAEMYAGGGNLQAAA